jgi:hypothetical protein
VSVFVARAAGWASPTPHHSARGLGFWKSIVVPLRRPTASTPALVDAACKGMRQIYQPGFPLIKAGVMLLDLVSDGMRQEHRTPMYTTRWEEVTVAQALSPLRSTDMCRCESNADDKQSQRYIRIHAGRHQENTLGHCRQAARQHGRR